MNGRDEKPPSAFQAALDTLKAAACGPTVLAVATTLLWSCIVYRVTLLVSICAADITPLSFVPNRDRLLMYLRYPILDLALAVVCTSPFYVVALLAGRRAGAAHRWAARLVTFVAFAVFGIATASHLRSLFALQSGLTADLAREGLENLELGMAVDYGEWPDLVVLLAPPVSFVVFLALATRQPRVAVRVGLAAPTAAIVIALAVSLVSMGVNTKRRHPAPALIEHPVEFLARDAWEDWRHDNRQEARLAAAVDFAAIAATSDDPALRVTPTAPSPEVVRDLGRKVRPRNVLLLVLESTGYRYVFNRRGGPEPMPFLKRLRKQGLWLARHRATSNSSARALFSIMTGLYPAPDEGMFVSRRDLRTPSLPEFLADYDRFLVTPGSLQSYFPLGLMRNAGMTDLRGRGQIKEHRPPTPGSVNELDAVDAFIRRLGEASTPFFGVYYSYAPHYDYTDYGPEYRIRPNIRSRRSRYLNSLRLLDTQIERIVAAVHRKAPPDETLIVLVGDHGEAFGQHEGNWTHSRHVFEENLRVPVLFVLPGTIEPGRVEEMTSHVDLLPTILDTLGIPYDPRWFQGLSILRGTGSRCSTYAVGNERSIVAVMKDGTKLILDWGKDECRRYDLSADPREMDPQSCGVGDADVDEALLFGAFQRRFLPVRCIERLLPAS